MLFDDVGDIEDLKLVGGAYVSLMCVCSAFVYEMHGIALVWRPHKGGVVLNLHYRIPPFYKHLIISLLHLPINKCLPLIQSIINTQQLLK